MHPTPAFVLAYEVYKDSRKFLSWNASPKLHPRVVFSCRRNPPTRLVMILCGLTVSENLSDFQPRLCAVDFLNTLPLVFGLTHSKSTGYRELTFAPPAKCALLLANGETDIGLIPVAELLSIPNLEILAEVGIASDGPVRSILLISKVPFGEVKTLAADENSRTSVQLARILLRQQGADPKITRHPPVWPKILGEADAALLIGDPALYLYPDEIRKEGLFVWDLGEEWQRRFQVPMVYAVWAGDSRWKRPEIAKLLERSLAEADLEQIVDSCSAPVSKALLKRYLSEHIRYRIGERERTGLARYLAEVKLLSVAATGA
jgi:chorismate dehydratase